MTGRQKILDQAVQEATQGAGTPITRGEMLRRPDGSLMTVEERSAHYERQRQHYHAVRERTRQRDLDRRGSGITTDLLRRWIAGDGSEVAAAELARRHPAQASAANLASPVVERGGP